MCCVFLLCGCGKIDDKDVVKELEKCELSFRDIDDKLLFGKEFLKDESAHIVRDKYGKPSIHIDFKDKDQAFEKTNEFSKKLYIK